MPWKEIRSHNSVAPIKNSPRGCPSRSPPFANRAVAATATALYSVATKRPPHRCSQASNREPHHDPQSVHEGLTQGDYREAIFTAGALIGKVAGSDRANVRAETLFQPELLPPQHEPAHVNICQQWRDRRTDRKSTCMNSSHLVIS